MNAGWRGHCQHLETSKECVNNTLLGKCPFWLQTSSYVNTCMVCLIYCMRMYICIHSYYGYTSDKVSLLLQIKGQDVSWKDLEHLYEAKTSLRQRSGGLYILKKLSLLTSYSRMRVNLAAEVWDVSRLLVNHNFMVLN